MLLSSNSFFELRFSFLRCQSRMTFCVDLNRQRQPALPPAHVFLYRRFRASATQAKAKVESNSSPYFGKTKQKPLQRSIYFAQMVPEEAKSNLRTVGQNQHFIDETYFFKQQCSLPLLHLQMIVFRSTPIQEWRHAHGMRCLGIPNTAHFANVTLIEDAVACNVNSFLY